MQPEVEVNDRPRSLPEPCVQALEAVTGGAAVFSGAMNIDVPGEPGPYRKRVTDRNEISNQQDPGQSGRVRHVRQSRQECRIQRLEIRLLALASRLHGGSGRDTLQTDKQQQCRAEPFHRGQRPEFHGRFDGAALRLVIPAP